MGAGPAGLTTAWELSRHAVPVRVFEADPQHVGGIARTESYKGFRFDIGGHRFFTKAEPVRQLWHEILPADQWLSRAAACRGSTTGASFFDYPLQGAATPCASSGWSTAVHVRGVVPVLRKAAPPPTPVRSFEDWT